MARFVGSERPIFNFKKIVVIIRKLSFIFTKKNKLLSEYPNIYVFFRIDNTALKILTFFVQIKWLQVFPKTLRRTFHHVRFSRKRGSKPPINSVFGQFWKIVELNTNMLEPSLLSGIDIGSLLFKISPKPNGGAFMSRGAREKEKLIRFTWQLLPRGFWGLWLQIWRSRFIKINQI